jgi:hypothetical protein
MSINRLDTRGYWMVGSNEIYIPSTPCKISHENIAGPSSGRDAAGYMHIDWVRRDVRKVTIAYNFITDTELRYVMSLMQGQEFTFTFRDQGLTQSMQAYAAQSSYESYSYSSFYNEGVYTNFTINVIEK